MTNRSTFLSRSLLAVTAAFASLAAPACSSDDDGQGTVTFTTYGEDFIEQKIPAETFADGWSVAYTRFLVVLGEVSVAETETSAPVARMPVARLFDLHKTGTKPVFTAPALPAKAYQHVSYLVGPATAATELGVATDADKQLMTTGGYSIYVEGTATKGTESKRFTWGFKTKTLLDRCEGEVSGKSTKGVVVSNGGTDAVELTIHGDHLFYDDLQDPEAKVRFDNIAAADANTDGEVTLEELAAVKLAAIPAEKGPYGTGSAPGINDLRAFVEALSRTVGHYRGEGECFAVPK
jgi:hypothetical protein